MTKNTKKNLLLLFFAVLIIKIVSSLLIKSIIVYPDESCILLKASSFIENFNIKNCSLVANMPAGDPFPLYSILLSPIFLYAKKFTAFKIALIFNAILTSTLVFPIFKILTRFIKKENKAVILTGLLLFISQVFLYEKMLMSENLFLVIGIWTLHTYLKSFEELKCKIISILLAILAVFTRPFGFILLLAIGINELILSKKKKTIALALFLAIGGIYFILQIYIPEISETLYQKLTSLSEPRNILLAGKAIKNQINSLIITTFFLPLVIFFSNFKDDKSKDFKNIRYFLLSFIIINLLISAQHIYFYYIRGIEQDLLTRYLNVSSFFIILFSFIFLEKYKKLKIKAIVILLFTIPLFFLSYNFLNHALNLELSPYFREFNGFISGEIFFRFIFLPIIFLLILAAIFKKKKILTQSLIIVLLINSIIVFSWQTSYTFKEYKDPILQEFISTENNILFIESAIEKDSRNNTNFDFWRLKTFTANKLSSITYNDKVNFSLELEDIPQEYLENKDYIITKFALNLPIIIDYPQATKVYKIEKIKEQ